MKLSIFPSSIETARTLIQHLLNLMDDQPDKVFHIALSGGNTSALMFDLWANEYKDYTPWHRMRIYWVDERCVPPEDSYSNYGMARSLLLGSSPISFDSIFRIHGENKPAKEAVRYSELVTKQVPQENGLPAFDIVLLGVGEDGHTSSIFPGQEELLSTDLIYASSYNPNNGQKRIALTGFPILNARNIIFLIVGRNKAGVVNEICRSGDTSPAAYIAHHGANVELFVDDLAASKVE